MAPAPVQVPPAECQEAAPDRVTFVTPVLPPRAAPEIDPLAGATDARVLATATRDELVQSRTHYLMRAQRAEPLASAALDYIERDRIRDAVQDDTWNRCAEEDRRDAAAQAAWAETNRGD